MSLNYFANKIRAVILVALEMIPMKSRTSCHISTTAETMLAVGAIFITTSTHHFRAVHNV